MLWSLLFILHLCRTFYLLHVGPQVRIRWVIDSLPAHRHINLLVKLQDHQPITQITAKCKQIRKINYKNPHV